MDMRKIFTDECTRIAARVFDFASGDLLALCECFSVFIGRRCESPIEQMLGLAIWLCAFRRSLYGPHYIHTAQNEEARYSDSDDVLLMAQFQHGAYRFDFALASRLLNNRYVFIECDGHDFHERTKEQAAHDRKKDRFSQINGIPILRYTGSEIYADPYRCAVEIVEFVESQIGAVLTAQA